MKTYQQKRGLVETIDNCEQDKKGQEEPAIKRKDRQPVDYCPFTHLLLDGNNIECAYVGNKLEEILIPGKNGNPTETAYMLLCSKRSNTS